MYGIWTSVSVLLAIYFLAKYLFRNKRRPPGPIPLPFVGNLHLLGGSPHKDMARLARKHGPIMYLQLGSVPTVVVSSPAGAELVLKTYDLICANRPHLAAVSRALGREHKALLLGHYGPSWRNLRKLCTLELLSTLKINQFHNMRKEEVRHLIRSLRDISEGTIVDVSAHSFDLSSDIMCRMLFGKKFPNKEMDNTGFKAVVADTVEIIGKLFIGDYFGFISRLDLQGLGRRLTDSSRRIEVFFDKIIEDHYQNYKQGNTQVAVDHDIVDTMISIMESGQVGYDLDLNQIKTVLLDMFIAGVDTTATTIEWTLSELLRHPMAMQKLQNEIEQIVGMEHMVEESHLEHLQYLDAVVKEALRLHPAGPLLLPHESMEDCFMDKFHIPKKTRIIVNAWAIGRDPGAWDDPESFTPERFIGKNIDVRGLDFKFIPFSAGRRICPGLQLGFLMVRLVVAQLVHCFNWQLPNNMLPNDLDMSEHFGTVTARDKPLLAIAKFRLDE